MQLGRCGCYVSPLPIGPPVLLPPAGPQILSVVIQVVGCEVCKRVCTHLSVYVHVYFYSYVVMYMHACRHALLWLRVHSLVTMYLPICHHQRERDTLAMEKKALEDEVMLAKQEVLQREQRVKDMEVCHGLFVYVMHAWIASCAYACYWFQHT